MQSHLFESKRTTSHTEIKTSTDTKSSEDTNDVKTAFEAVQKFPIFESLTKDLLHKMLDTKGTNADNLKSFQNTRAKKFAKDLPAAATKKVDYLKACEEFLKVYDKNNKPVEFVKSELALYNLKHATASETAPDNIQEKHRFISEIERLLQESNYSDEISDPKFASKGTTLYACGKITDDPIFIDMETVLKELNGTRAKEFVASTTQIDFEKIPSTDLERIENCYHKLRDLSKRMTHIARSVMRPGKITPQKLVNEQLFIQSKLHLQSFILYLFPVLKQFPDFLMRNEHNKILEEVDYLCEDFVHDAKQHIIGWNSIYSSLLKLYPKLAVLAKNNLLDVEDIYSSTTTAFSVLEYIQKGHDLNRKKMEAQAEEQYAKARALLKYTPGDAPTLAQYHFIWSMHFYSIAPYANTSATRMVTKSQNLELKTSKHALSEKVFTKIKSLVDMDCKTATSVFLENIRRDGPQKQFENILYFILREYDFHHGKKDKSSLEKALRALELYARHIACISCVERKLIGIYKDFDDLRMKHFPETNDMSVSLFESACNKYNAVDEELNALLKKQNLLPRTDNEVVAYQKRLTELELLQQKDDELASQQLKVEEAREEKEAADKEKKRLQKKQKQERKEQAQSAKSPEKAKISEPQSDLLIKARAAVTNKDYLLAKKYYHTIINEAKKTDDHSTIVESLAEISHVLFANAIKNMKQMMQSSIKADVNCIPLLLCIEQDLQSAINFAEIALDYSVGLIDKNVNNDIIKYIKNKLTYPLNMVMTDAQKQLSKTHAYIKGRNIIFESRIELNKKEREQVKKELGPRWFKRTNPKCHERKELNALEEKQKIIKKIDSHLQKSTVLFLEPLADLTYLHPPQETVTKIKMAELKDAETALVVIDNTKVLVPIDYQQKLQKLGERRKARKTGAPSLGLLSELTVFRAANAEPVQAQGQCGQSEQLVLEWAPGDRKSNCL